MKIGVLALLFVVTASFIVIETDKQSATVEKRNGISVFILSTPKAEYTTLESIKISFAMSGANNDLLESLIKKAKKQQPNCDGIILYDLSFEKADVIKFK